MLRPIAIKTPIVPQDIADVAIGDALSINGAIFTGRDAVLPSLVSDLATGTYSGPSLEGGVVFHAAVSCAGVGPTSSNKLEIEESIVPLSRAGVRIHMGKGALSPETIDGLAQCGSIYVVTPPTTALFEACVLSREIVYRSDLGMEAMNRLVVDKFPCIVAAAHGESIYD